MPRISCRDVKRRCGPVCNMVPAILPGESTRPRRCLAPAFVRTKRRRLYPTLFFLVPPDQEFAEQLLGLLRRRVVGLLAHEFLELRALSSGFPPPPILHPFLGAATPRPPL